MSIASATATIPLVICIIAILPPPPPPPQYHHHHPNNKKARRNQEHQSPLPPPPPSGGFSSCITELELSNCGLTSLPDAIADLTGLRKLNAAKNRLRGLPSGMAALQELRIAFFLGNEFETVPSVLGQLKVSRDRSHHILNSTPNAIHPTFHACLYTHAHCTLVCTVGGSKSSSSLSRQQHSQLISITVSSISISIRSITAMATTAPSLSEPFHALVQGEPSLIYP